MTVSAEGQRNTYLLVTFTRASFQKDPSDHRSKLQESSHVEGHFRQQFGSHDAGGVVIQACSLGLGVKLVEVVRHWQPCAGS